MLTNSARHWRPKYMHPSSRATWRPMSCMHCIPLCCCCMEGFQLQSRVPVAAGKGKQESGASMRALSSGCSALRYRQGPVNIDQ